MPLTKPQQRLFESLRSRDQLVHYLHGGGGGSLTGRQFIAKPSSR